MRYYVDKAWMEDQRIQKKWDDYLRRRPVCCLCGAPILTVYALKLVSQWYCEDCVSSYTQEVEES